MRVVSTAQMMQNGIEYWQEAVQAAKRAESPQFKESKGLLMANARVFRRIGEAKFNFPVTDARRASGRFVLSS